MRPADLALHPSPWLKTLGPCGDVVFSTRIRLARNVEGYPFPARLKEPDPRREFEARLAGWLGEARPAEDLHYWNLDGLKPIERLLLMERHLISRELAQGDGDRGVCFSSAEQISIMTNEEDHLRIQVIRPGLAIDEALAMAIEIDRKLETRIPYAFDDQLGYLTACPTNVGTGLRISVMMHLPGLVLGEQMDKVFNAASRVGLAVRGSHGEGSKAVGDVVQISNQHTLGRTEEEIAEVVRAIVAKIVDYERGVRQHLLEESRARLEDKIWRSVGVLRTARLVGSEESQSLLSAVRLGISMKLYGDLRIGDLNELLVLTQPGHLQAIRGKEIRADDRDAVRATLLRERFKAESN